MSHPSVYQVLCVLAPLYPSPIVSQVHCVLSQCVPGPLCPSPIVSQSHCVPGALCPIPVSTRPIVYQSHCVIAPLYPSPIVSQMHCVSSQCVPGPLCTRPLVSQSSCIPVPLCPRCIVPQSQCVPSPLCPRSMLRPCPIVYQALLSQTHCISVPLYPSSLLSQAPCVPVPCPALTVSQIHIVSQFHCIRGLASQSCRVPGPYCGPVSLCSTPMMFQSYSLYQAHCGPVPGLGFVLHSKIGTQWDWLVHMGTAPGPSVLKYMPSLFSVIPVMRGLVPLLVIFP